MRKLILLLLFLVCSVGFSSIAITGIDVSGFPNVRVFVRSDEGAVSEVLDNGVSQKFNIQKIGSGSLKDVDIAFVFDTTGSMREEIDDLKSSAVAFASKISSVGVSPKLAIVTFGDEIRDVVDFTSNVEEFKNIAGKLKADGGGDDPECSLDALVRASGLSYRSGAQKIAILVTDAPYHYRGDGTVFSKVILEEVVNLYKDLGFVLFAVAPSMYSKLAENLNGVWIDITKERSFAKVLDSISSLIVEQYEVSYKIDDLTPNKLHKVQVKSKNIALGEYTSPNKVSVTPRTVGATGMGVVPVQKYNTPSGFLAARTAAILDAQKGLLELLKGVKITGTETIEDGALKDRRIMTAVKGLVSGAIIDKEEYDPVTGVYRVWMHVDLFGDEGLFTVLRNLEAYRLSEDWKFNENQTLRDLRGGYLKAVGYSIIEDSSEPGKAIYKARNAAIADAQVRLLEMLEGLNIDSEVKVIDFTSNTVIKKQIEGILRGAEIVNEGAVAIPQYGVSGLYMVEMAVPLMQRAGVFGILLNEIGVPSSHKLASTMPATMPVSTTGTAVTTPAPELKKYTGLIIEASGLGLIPAIFPRIYSENGELIYSVDALSKEALCPMFYTLTYAEALKLPIIGEEPMVIKAKAVKGSDIYISNEDAKMLKMALELNNFLSKGLVATVIGG